MSNLLVNEIDSSIYNVEVILRLLNNERLSPYKIAKPEQKSQKHLRKACEFLQEKGIIDMVDQKGKAKYYSINYKQLSELFFSYFEEQLKRSPTKDEKEIFEEYLRSKSCSSLAKKTIIENKIVKGSMVEFLDLTYAYLYGLSMLNLFTEKIKEAHQKLSKGGFRDKSRIIERNMSGLGIHLDEMKSLFPKLLKTYAEIFKEDKHVSKIKRLFELD